LKTSSVPDLYVALVHYPVINKKGEIITSAVTNLDLHDIARASRTYGIRQFYVITPLEDQKELTQKILSHWISGSGAVYNHIRGNALEIVRIRDSIEIVLEEIREKRGRNAKTIVTSAKKNSRSIGFSELKNKLKTGTPHILMFGTAWGLGAEIIEKADYILEPIMADSDYNHLSVRSAVSITLDRLIYEEPVSE
jgi:hypothetical protein